MKVIKRGAESEIILDENIIRKVRIKKDYRNERIDVNLRRKRTKYEARIMEKLRKKGINVPEIFNVGEFEIKMEFLNGKTLRDILLNNKKEYRKFSDEIGRMIALMHKENIIHGDLTTANMILKDGRIYFIDFGLSFHSNRIEDKAVDLHLLKEALRSGHFEIWQDFFNEILESYRRNYDGSDQIIKRLGEIERRGRYK